MSNTNIVKLDDLVPEDIVFEFRGKEYVVPGDLDTESVFRVFQHLRKLYDSRPADGEPMDERTVKDAAKSLEDLLISIFQIRDPHLQGPLPFGAKALSIVTERILEQIGIGGEAEEEVPTVRASRSAKKSSPASARRSPAKRS